MGTIVPGFDALLASTDDPLAILSACHTRVRRQCTTLHALLVHLDEVAADDQAAGAAHRVLRYFDEAAQHHHADEEKDLFPRLIKAATQDQRESVSKLCAELTAQHEEMAKLWAALRPALIQVRSHQMPDKDSLQSNVKAFTEAYETHTTHEDEHLLPLAQALLGTKAIESLGLSMKARRQST